MFLQSMPAGIKSSYLIQESEECLKFVFFDATSSTSNRNGIQLNHHSGSILKILIIFFQTGYPKCSPWNDSYMASILQ